MEPRYTCDEVAAMYHVTRHTVYEWVRSGRLPAMSLGRNYVFRPEDLAVFENNCRKVNEQ